ALAAGEDNGVPETEISPEDDLVSVCTLKSEADAKLAKALLDANFIASCLGPDNIVDLENFKGSFDGGIELKVFSDFYHRASAVLAQYAPDLMKDDDLPDDYEDLHYVVTCPKCQLEDVIFEEADAQPQDAHLWNKVRWTCAACGHQWQDNGIAHIVDENAR